MAGKKKKADHTLTARPGHAELLLGWCWLPFYFILLSYLLRYAGELLHLEMTGLQQNLAFFGINFALVVLGFRDFLKRSFRALSDDFWLFLQTLILGFVFYGAVTMALTWVLRYIFGETTNFNNETVMAMVVQDRTAMFFCTVLAAPLVEEVLIRGVVFGTFQPRSRTAAYVISVLLFSLMHIWQYAGRADIPSLISSGLTYLPAAAALGWTYEKSGTVWTSVALHAGINALSFFGIALF